MATIAGSFPTDLSIGNNGRKIARTSNGDLYVVYSKNGKIFLAKSTDGGQSWTDEDKIQIAPDADGSLDQKEPSIAIDSQDNLHIVWQGKVGTSIVYQIRYQKYNSSLEKIEDLNLTNNSDFHQEIPVIVIDSNNNPHIIWARAENVVIIQPDIFRKIGIIYATKNENSWQIEEVSCGSERIIFSFNLAIDSQNNLHLVRQSSIRSGPSVSSVIAYQKYIVSWQPTQYLYAEASTFVSLAIDINKTLHIVWNDRRGISYKIHPFSSESFVWSNNYCETGIDNQVYCFYGDDDESQILLNFPDGGLHPVISLDFNNVAYLLWSKFSSLEQKKFIPFQRYPNSWLTPQVLEVENSQASQLYPNLLWSLTNQPKTGFAFIFYGGGELKFYGSQDLTW